MILPTLSVSSRSSPHLFSPILFVCLLFVFRTCSFLADVRQVVVAGNVVPFAVLMGDHHHAVFPTGEEVVGLIFAPVLVLLGTGKKRTLPFKFSQKQFCLCSNKGSISLCLTLIIDDKLCSTMNSL